MKDIEQEIQERVNFKLNEILSAVENTANINWNIAFQTNSPKHQHYWEAFNMFKSLVNKEMNLPVPNDKMFEEKKRKKRDVAINKIMNRFTKRGAYDYYAKEKLLVAIIKDVQNI